MNAANTAEPQAGPSSVEVSTMRCLSRKRKQPDSDEEALLEMGAHATTEESPSNQASKNAEDDSRAKILRDLENDERFQDAQESEGLKLDYIEVTPFNLKEELEEGKFDQEGNFIFKKRDDPDPNTNEEDEDEDDTWAESVDWAEVRRKENERTQMLAVSAAASAQDSEMTDDFKINVPERDKMSCYLQMLRLMKPNEGVKKTIQRLGNAVPKKKPFNKNATKLKDGTAGSGDPESVAEVRRRLDLMIELAHQRLEDGDINIYQRTYEELEEAINE